MQYYSTNHQAGFASFREATILGQAPDRGLFFPAEVPVIDPSFIANMENLSDAEIAFRVIEPYVGHEIPAAELFRIVDETVNFPMPLVNVNDRIASLELYHGPTLAFKDVGARFMSRCLRYFVREQANEVTVLVATSGDTGGAVANGFYDVEGVRVVILYPSGKVSPVQEKQLTTLQRNIYAVEVNGTFDDCQRMVKAAFLDEELRKRLFLTSANSINVARWLPQQFYYFFAYRQWGAKNSPPIIAVPSGNFGNICAGMLAMRSGLPVKKFVAACNVNDVVTGFLQTREWKPRQALPTLSNAMDVGDPSNFARILELFGHRFPDLREKLVSYAVTDQQTLDTIRRVYREFQYVLDPHGAVAYYALEQYLESEPDDRGIILETAHPVKFPAAVELATGQAVDIPGALSLMMTKDKKAVYMEPSLQNLKELLLQSAIR